jgi:hypothetical protein
MDLYIDRPENITATIGNFVRVGWVSFAWTIEKKTSNGYKKNVFVSDLFI